MKSDVKKKKKNKLFRNIFESIDRVRLFPSIILNILQGGAWDEVLLPFNGQKKRNLREKVISMSQKKVKSIHSILFLCYFILP